MNDLTISSMTDEDWIDLGKADAWAGKIKQSPEHDPQAASMYDLGYCEGEIGRSPLKPKQSLESHLFKQKNISRKKR